MIRVCVVLLIAVIGLGSAWQLERTRSRIALQDATIATLSDQLKTRDTDLKRERDWSESRENVIAALLKIGQDVQVMQDEIKRQDKVRAAQLQELIKNDKAVREYMALAVPANLGLQYQRRATTDPTQYGTSRSVPTGAVQPASKATPKVQ